MIEFMPWYVPGDTLVRCGGDKGCGAVIGDTEAHMKFHKRLDLIEARLNHPEHHTRVLGV